MAKGVALLAEISLNAVGRTGLPKDRKAEWKAVESILNLTL